MEWLCRHWRRSRGDALQKDAVSPRARATPQPGSLGRSLRAHGRRPRESRRPWRRGYGSEFLRARRSCVTSFLPPFAERLFWHRLEISRLSPAAKQAREPVNPAGLVGLHWLLAVLLAKDLKLRLLFADERRFGDAAEALRGAEAALGAEDLPSGLHRDSLRRPSFALDHLVTQMNQHLGDVDL